MYRIRNENFVKTRKNNCPAPFIIMGSTQPSSFVAISAMFQILVTVIEYHFCSSSTGRENRSWKKDSVKHILQLVRDGGNQIDLEEHNIDDTGGMSRKKQEDQPEGVYEEGMITVEDAKEVCTYVPLRLAL